MEKAPGRKSNRKRSGLNPANRKTVIKDLQDLQHEELSGVDEADRSALYSTTDEDEKEAVGDGKIGRSRKNILNR